MAKKKAADNGAFQALKQDLKTGQLAGCYVLHGEEDYLRTYYYERMKKKLLDGPAEEFNYHRFSKENLDWDEVVAAVEAIPMMAERTLVEISDVDLYKEPEAARSKLISILEDIPDYCCIVFLYDTVEFSPDRRLKKLQSAIDKHAQIICFQKQTAADIRTWVKRQLLAEGREMEPDTIDYLAFLTDNSLSSIQSELQKLTAYASGKIITKQDVDTVVEPTLTAVSFDISNAIIDGDYERALRKLRELLAMQQDPILLLGAIAAQIRRIHCAKVLSENGQGGDRLMKLCGMGDYAARLTMGAARKLSSRFCSNAVLYCLDTDRKMKMSFDAPERLLELLLFRLAQEARE